MNDKTLKQKELKAILIEERNKRNEQERQKQQAIQGLDFIGEPPGTILGLDSAIK